MLPHGQDVELHTLELRNDFSFEEAARTHESTLVGVQFTEDNHFQGVFTFAAAVWLAAARCSYTLSNSLGQV